MKEYVIYPNTHKLGKKVRYKFYLTNNPCKHGHYSLRRVAGGRCQTCHEEKLKRQKEEYRNNSEYKELFKNRARERHILLENDYEYVEKRKSYFRARYKNNREEELQRLKEYRDNNKDKRKRTCRKWNENNKHRLTANAAERRARKRKAIPHWVKSNKQEKEDIRNLYLMRDELTTLTGEEWNIDHIVPLKASSRYGEQKACGLHTLVNLTLMKATENLKKGQYSWPDMWDYEYED